MKKIPSVSNLPKDVSYDEMDSPVGRLTIITSVNGLHALLWDRHRLDADFEERLSAIKKNSSDPVIKQTKIQLDEYFSGKRQNFQLPLVIEGSPFQKQAWNALIKIPYGTTISYAEQAQNIGDRNKARAVGMANSLNPISIIIPCHRVIGSNKKLVGFGGGLDKKAYLLDLEKKATGSHL